MTIEEFSVVSAFNERERAALGEIVKDAAIMEAAKAISQNCFFPGGEILAPTQDETFNSKAWFAAAFLSADASREQYRKLQFPEDVWRESMTDLKVWLRFEERNNGVIGLGKNPRSWQVAIYRGEVTRHGRLECNTELYYSRDALFDEDGAAILKAGDPVICLHIPEEGPMDMPSCSASIKRMAAFFAKYRPLYEWKGFLCESWLLDSQLLTMLSENSNIAKFQALGQHYIIEPTDSTIWRIFGTKDPFTIENPTSLQRNAAQFIKNGGKFIEEGMFIPRAKIEAVDFDLTIL